MTVQEIQKLFPLTGQAGKDELCAMFRDIAAQMVALIPANARRAAAIRLLAATYRESNAAFLAPMTDADRAAQKLTELFPDGQIIPGQHNPDPIERMANAIAAMKAKE